jgi:hypothetical protein
MNHHHDIKTASLALYGFVGTLIVMVLVFVMVVLYYQTTSRLEYERNISQPYAELETALEDQRIRLVEYERGDTVQVDGQPQTQFRIPIDEAMEIVLKEWDSGVPPGPPSKRVELADPLPVAAPGDASGSEKSPPLVAKQPVTETPAAEPPGPKDSATKPVAGSDTQEPPAETGKPPASSAADSAEEDQDDATP